MPRGGRGELDEDANAGGRAQLKPRVCMVVDVDAEAAQADQKREDTLAELRKRALAALNLGLPPSCEEVDDEATPAGESEERGSGHARCTCLRRSGRCTCTADRAWLQSKRQEVSMYQAPHLRHEPSSSKAATSAQKRPSGSVADGEANEGTLCTCLRRSGRCTCKQDAAWLQKKRRLVVPFVPPHVQERDANMHRGKEVEAEVCDEKKADVVSERASTASGGTATRRLAREWNSRLEQRGDSRFNPLQMDGQIVLEDADGLVAECVDHPLSSKGVKGLPVIQSGRYQYEVELLRDCSIMIGWSGAMTLPGVLDFQGYAYSSSGCKCHGPEESPYGKPFGKAGDIIGAFLDWVEPETASGSSSIEISFCLNGESLGPAFNVVANLADARKEAPVPLQPHICQLPKGDMLKVRLLGCKAGLPLTHPLEGYQPLSAVSDMDFCPFSSAVAAATSERVIMNLTPESLQSFRLPETHIVELYDFPADTSGEQLMSSVACFLGLKRYLGVLHVCITEAGSSTALAACRRPEHAEKLIEATSTDDFGVADCMGLEKKRDKPFPFEARPLSLATARSKQRLGQFRE